MPPIRPLLRFRPVLGAARTWGVIPALAALGALAGCTHAARPASPKAPATELLASPRPLVIAHRGASAAAPENTLAAFRLGLAAQADLIELDYHHSRNGVPVVIHDATLDRTTDAGVRWGAKQIRVADRPAEELVELSAGQWFDPSSTERLPRLTEALQVIRDGGGVTLIERKAGDAATLARLLREHDLVNRVVVQSFDWVFLRELHAALPEQVLAALGPPHRRVHPDAPPLREGSLDEPALDELAAAGVRVVVWNRSLSPAALAAAHARGFKVWIYTIDDPTVARELLARGVDGLIANRPELLRPLLDQSRRTP